MKNTSKILIGLLLVLFAVSTSYSFDFGDVLKELDPNKKEDAHHLLEALWLHQQHNVVNEELLTALLDSPELHAQEAAQLVKYMWDIEGKFEQKVATVQKKTLVTKHKPSSKKPGTI